MFFDSAAVVVTERAEVQKACIFAGQLEFSRAAYTHLSQHNYRMTYLHTAYHTVKGEQVGQACQLHLLLVLRGEAAQRNIADDVIQMKPSLSGVYAGFYQRRIDRTGGTVVKDVPCLSSSTGDQAAQEHGYDAAPQ